MTGNIRDESSKSSVSKSRADTGWAFCGAAVRTLVGTILSVGDRKDSAPGRCLRSDNKLNRSQ